MFFSFGSTGQKRARESFKNHMNLISVSVNYVYVLFVMSNEEIPWSGMPE